MTQTKIKPRPLWRGAYSKQRAEEYAVLLRNGLGPLYRTVLDAMAESLRLQLDSSSPRLLDLGAGTGNLAERLLKEFPEVRIVCLDGSAEMLDVARRKFAGDARVCFVERDFGRPDWSSGLGVFDAVVSTGAIHHLDGRGKAELFKRIFGLLGRGGVFLCGDQLRGEGTRLDRLYETAWVRVIQRNLAEQGQDIPLEDIRRRHRSLQAAEGDQPSRLAPQLEWLGQAGFRDVDCFWKYFVFALYGGRRP